MCHSAPTLFQQRELKLTVSMLKLSVSRAVGRILEILKGADQGAPTLFIFIFDFSAVKHV